MGSSPAAIRWYAPASPMGRSHRGISTAPGSVEPRTPDGPQRRSYGLNSDATVQDASRLVGASQYGTFCLCTSLERRCR